MRATLSRVTVIAAFACVGPLALPTAALGASPVPGALYTGNSGVCSASISKECVFKFRVSSNGQTLRFVKRTNAISTWQCQGGGGEAVFGSGTNAYTIPPAHIHTNGTFSGTNGTGTKKLRITGSFTHGGKQATVKFALPNQHCTTPDLTLHKK